MTLRIAIIGDLAADILPDATVPGGAAAIALALARLGASVTLRAVCSTDEDGTRMLASLEDGGVSTRLIDRTDGASTTRIIRDTAGHETSRQPGIGIEKGAKMDIYDLFGHDVLILDCADQPLRRFLSDLPAHTDPNVLMLGTLRHLDWQEPSEDEFEIAMRFDLITGTERQYAALTGHHLADRALTSLSDRMPGAHLRTAVAVTPDAIDAVSREERMRVAWDGLPDIQFPQIVANAALMMATRQPLASLTPHVTG